MKRQDYEDTAMRIWVDREKEKVCFRLSWEQPTSKGDGLVELEFGQVKVPCEVCNKSITLEDAVKKEEDEIYNIKEYGKQIGRDEENFHVDFKVPFYCSKNHAIAGEL